MTAKNAKMPFIWRLALWAGATVFYGLLAGGVYARLILGELYAFYFSQQIALPVLWAAVAYGGLVLGALVARKRLEVGVLGWQLVTLLAIMLALFWYSSQPMIRE